MRCCKHMRLSPVCAVFMSTQACLERVLNATEVPVFCTLRTRKRCELSRSAPPAPSLYVPYMSPSAVPLLHVIRRHALSLKTRNKCCPRTGSLLCVCQPFFIINPYSWLRRQVGFSNWTMEALTQGLWHASREGEPGAVHHVLNECLIDRGSSPNMVRLDLYVDGHHITTVQVL